MDEEKKLPEQPAAKPKADKPVKDPRAKLYQPEHMLIMSSSPHLGTADSVSKIMWTVIVALLPAVVMATYYFGWAAIFMVGTCVATALLTEALVNRLKGETLTIKDGSAAITGLLLALTLPPSFHLTGAVIGTVFAIGIGKHIFGGLGYNIFNPALLGRAFLQASFPVAITTWTNPRTIDAVSTATPLGAFKFEKIGTALVDLLYGNTGGCLGETSAIVILAGGLFLIIKKYADWRIPASYLGSVFVLGGIFWLIDPVQYPDPFFHLFSGGLMLGAFFMATDMVTSPITPKGSWIFGTGAGILLVIIRLWGGLPEGVMYSILLMNACTPLINRYTRPQYFGEPRA
ncbi:MAG: RnfABCDGE type electron transport complex subunit D [Candidatus Neomarinimicrobiota bacterium]